MAAEAFKRQGNRIYAVSVLEEKPGFWRAVARIGHIENDELVADFPDMASFSEESSQAAYKEVEERAISLIRDRDDWNASGAA